MTKSVSNVKLNRDQNQILLWILQEIKKESIATPPDRYIYLEFRLSTSNKNIPSLEEQYWAIRVLENDKAIEVKKKKYHSSSVYDYLLEGVVDIYGLKPIGVFLNILQPRFDEIYNTIKESIEGASSLVVNEYPVYQTKEKRVLFNKKSISIPEGYQTMVCKVLLKDKASMKKMWVWDEVFEADDEFKAVEKKDLFTKEMWRKVYDAGREINTKIAIETGIKDFLLIKTKTVSVNPKYLPKS